jgi:hypothetical protein
MFRLHPLRFRLKAARAMRFPVPAANVFRSALGPALRSLVCESNCLDPLSCPDKRDCAYARAFEPAPLVSASGFRTPPRPFVFRAAHLDGCEVTGGEEVAFDLHLFDTRADTMAAYVEAIRRMAEAGFGGSRFALAGVEHGGRVWMDGVEPVALRLEGNGQARDVRLRFETPTELKAESALVERPGFPVLFARLRDRVALLHAQFADSPLAADFTKLREAAAPVELVEWNGQHVRAERRSFRTGETHPLGGFTGEALYRGVCGSLMPWLHVGMWTGVGRQTVWGKGQYQVIE